MKYLFYFTIVLISSLFVNICLVKNGYATRISMHYPDKATQPQKPLADPDANFSVGEKLCANDTIWFKNETTGDYTNVLWNFGDSLDAVAWNNPYHIYTKSGVYKVTLTAILDQPGGTPKIDVYEKEITVNPSPEAVFMYDGSETDTIGILGKAMNVEAKGEFENILWTHSQEASTSVRIIKSGIYSAIITNELGCSIKQYTKQLVFKEEEDINSGIIVENNILTPNNDGINDELQIKDLLDTSVYPNQVKMKIFNVWGSKVFETSDYRQVLGWKGADVDAGTYYYHITTKGKPGKTGYIDVLK